MVRHPHTRPRQMWGKDRLVSQSKHRTWKRCSYRTSVFQTQWRHLKWLCHFVMTKIISYIRIRAHESGHLLFREIRMGRCCKPHKSNNTTFPLDALPGDLLVVSDLCLLPFPLLFAPLPPQPRPDLCFSFEARSNCNPSSK